MAPKRKAEADTPTAALTEEEYKAQQAEQRSYLLSAGIIAEESVDSGVETTPPAKKAKKDKVAITPTEEQLAPHSTAATPASAIAAGPEAQGTTSTPAKKTPARKRKTATTAADVLVANTTPQDGAETQTPTAAVPKQKKPASAPRKPRKTKGDAATTANDATPGAGAASAPLPPLSSTLRAKIHNVTAFINTSQGPSISRISAESNHARVRESDIIAALMVLRTDYGLGNPYNSVSLNDAEDMIVERYEDGWCTVNFDRTVPIEREAQAQIAGRGLELEDVNLLEVEMEMMKSSRDWLTSEGYGDTEFWVWDEEGRPLEVDVPEASESVTEESWRIDVRKGVCPAPMLEV